MLGEKELLTVNDFWKLSQSQPDALHRMELIDGQVVRRPVDTLSHSLCQLVYAQLEGFIRPRKLGHLSTTSGFYRSRDQHNVRLPDISFISYERTQPLIRQGFSGFVPYMPDLAIIIQLPTMSMLEIAERGMYFLKNGSSLVWLLHPRQGTADVCTRSPKKSFRVYKVGINGTLGGGDVLPGFSLELSSLFAS
jgi:Uma2 family endonuclease